MGENGLRPLADAIARMGLQPNTKEHECEGISSTHYLHAMLSSQLMMECCASTQSLNTSSQNCNATAEKYGIIP